MFFILIIFIFAGYSQEPGVFFIHLTPGGILPLKVTKEGESDDYFNISGGIGVKGEYVLLAVPFVLIGGGIDYTLAPGNLEGTVELNFTYLGLSGKGGLIFIF